MYAADARTSDGVTRGAYAAQKEWQAVVVAVHILSDAACICVLIMPLEGFKSVSDDASLTETLQQRRHTLLVYTSADCVICKRIYASLDGM